MTLVLPLILLTLLWPSPLLAWGPTAHRAVAVLAGQRLTPVTARAVARLLGRESMADASVWADEVRNSTHRHTTSWHFTNIPLAGEGYRATRDCPQRACVVAAIERQEAILRDRSRPLLQRREALRFVIHLVGDVHQPLHAADAGDRGGNSREVAVIGGARNLHAAWDSGILQAHNGTVATLVAAAARWLRTQTESTLAGGTAADWANESHALARRLVYRQVEGDDAIVGPERSAALDGVERQVGRAGVRLAAVLNRAIASSGEGPP